jgi:hypothetical protein
VYSSIIAANMQGTETPPPQKEETFARLFLQFMLSSVGVAVPLILILRLGLRMSWNAVAVRVMFLALVFAVFFVAIFPARDWLRRRQVWSGNPLEGGLRCERCHHYHEGLDCKKCGCRADQFVYPSIGSGFP